MQKITYSSYGSHHLTQLSNLDTLKIQFPDDVLIHVKAASLNPVDWKIRTGEMKLLTGSKFPRGMGCDFAGVVESVGTSASKFKVGDRVFGFLPFKNSGSFAEQVIAKESLLGKIPDHLSFDEASCLPMAGSAALTALTKKSSIKSGDRVFIAGCTGGVGHLAVQIAKSFGAIVAGSCHPEDFTTAKTIGVDEVYDYSHLNPKDIETCEIIFDTSGRMRRNEVICLLPKGLLPMTVSGKFIDLNPKPTAILKSLVSTVHKVVITKVTSDLIIQIEKLVFDKKLKPMIGHTFKLNQAVDIIDQFEKGKIKTKGKIVFSV